MKDTAKAVETKGVLNLMKKLVSLILAIMMVAAVGAAFAANVSTLTNGVASNTGDLMVGNTINFTKELVIYNTDSSNSISVHEPTITYTYSIAPAVATTTTAEGAQITSASVTDSDQTTAVVYNGVSGAVSWTKNTAVYSSANMITTTSGKYIDQRTLTLAFNPDNTFTHAGVYRYKITESAMNGETNLRTIAEVSSGDSYIEDRYLDVYVRVDVNDEDSDSSTTDYVIYGYVLFEGAAGDAITTSTSKSTGYVQKTATSNNDVDYYNTYNLKVIKAVSGSLADKNEDFPFQIIIANSTVKANVALELAGQLTGTTSITANATSGLSQTWGALTTSSQLKLKDTEYVYIYGIPAGTTATVGEMNSSYDIYLPSFAVTGGTTTAYTGANLASQATTTFTTDLADQITITSDHNAASPVWDDVVATATNTIQTISPTGYVTRFAPYALILIGGIALLIVAKKRKPAKVDEE